MLALDQQAHALLSELCLQFPDVLVDWQYTSTFVGNKDGFQVGTVGSAILSKVPKTVSPPLGLIWIVLSGAFST